MSKNFPKNFHNKANKENINQNFIFINSSNKDKICNNIYNNNNIIHKKEKKIIFISNSNYSKLISKENINSNYHRINNNNININNYINNYIKKENIIFIGDSFSLTNKQKENEEIKIYSEDKNLDDDLNLNKANLKIGKLI